MKLGLECGLHNSSHHLGSGMTLSGEFMLLLSVKCPEGLPFGWLYSACSVALQTTYFWEHLTEVNDLQGALAGSIQIWVQPFLSVCVVRKV